MKIARFLAQTITGACAMATLWAGKVMALTVQEGAEIARADGMPAELIGPDGVINHITDIALGLVGLVSVIMLIWGGLRYIISGGDNKKVTDAKNTILYAIIGLIISLLAYAIIHFIINTITGTNTVVE